MQSCSVSTSVLHPPSTQFHDIPPLCLVDPHVLSVGTRAGNGRARRGWLPQQREAETGWGRKHFCTQVPTPFLALLFQQENVLAYSLALISTPSLTQKIFSLHMTWSRLHSLPAFISQRMYFFLFEWKSLPLKVRFLRGWSKRLYLPSCGILFWYNCCKLI